MPKKKRRKQSPRTISTDHIETQRLSLVDELGRKRAELFCGGSEGGTNGHTVFRLNGDDGSERVNIQVDARGSASIQLYSAYSVVGFAEIHNPQVEAHPGLEPPYLLIISPGKNLTITTNGVKKTAAPESALPTMPVDRSATQETKNKEE
jgi:hypothetical protein